MRSAFVCPRPGYSHSSFVAQVIPPTSGPPEVLKAVKVSRTERHLLHSQRTWGSTLVNLCYFTLIGHSGNAMCKCYCKTPLPNVILQVRYICNHIYECMLESSVLCINICYSNIGFDCQHKWMSTINEWLYCQTIYECVQVLVTFGEYIRMWYFMATFVYFHMYAWMYMDSQWNLVN